jgi:hypothetical protein
MPLHQTLDGMTGKGWFIGEAVGLPRSFDHGLRRPQAMRRSEEDTHQLAVEVAERSRIAVGVVVLKL